MKLVWFTPSVDGRVECEHMRRFGEYSRYAVKEGIEVLDLHSTGDSVVGRNRAVEFARYLSADRLMMVDSCCFWNRNENLVGELENGLAGAVAIGAVVLARESRRPVVRPYRPRSVCDVELVSASILLIDMHALEGLDQHRSEPWFDRRLTGDGCQFGIKLAAHFCKTVRTLGGRVRAHQGIPTVHVHNESSMFVPALTPSDIGG